MNITERLSRLMTAKSEFKVKIDETLPLTEQANTFFDKVYKLENLKRTVYQNITSEKKQINTLLIGPPATAKSLIAQTIREKCNDVVYYDGATGGSGAGLINVLRENEKTAKFIIIDEIDKMKKNDQNVLLGLLGNGSVDKDLKSENIHLKMDVKIIMTANSNKKFGKAFLSRSDVCYIEEYTNEEFVEVVTYCLRDDIYDVSTERAQLIAQILIENNMKDIRTALIIAKKIKRNYTDDDVILTIEDKISLSKNSKKVVDYN